MKEVKKCIAQFRENITVFENDLLIAFSHKIREVYTETMKEAFAEVLKLPRLSRKSVLDLAKKLKVELKDYGKQSK